jgi:exosome complex component RRP41
MRDLVASCAAGKVADTVVVDLAKEEDNFGQADIPLGYVPRTGDIVLLQMDGDLTREQFEKGLSMAIEGCKKVYEVQRDALKRRYTARSVDADLAPSESEAGKEGV